MQIAATPLKAIEICGKKLRKECCSGGSVENKKMKLKKTRSTKRLLLCEITKKMTYPNHTINKYLNRAEPTQTLCGYCNFENVTNINDCHYLPIYKTKDRLNIIVLRTVDYKSIYIGIPRCKNCLSKHNSARLKALLILITIGISIIFFDAYFLFASKLFMLGTILVAICLPLVMIFYFRLNKFLLQKHNIQSEMEVGKNDILVNEFLLKGWQLNKPRA